MKKENEVKTKPCPQCEGQGYVKKVYSYPKFGISGQDLVECPVCDGYGFVIIETPSKEIKDKEV